MNSLAWFAVYLTFGFAITVAIVRHANGGLCVLDFVACAALSIVWPVTVTISLIAALVCGAPWLTEVRYLKRKT